MNKNRFRLDRAKKEFDCYDCRNSMFIGSEFAWDNLRNCKVCEPCLKKLSDLLEDETSREKIAAAAAVIKSDSERIQALEEQVNTLSLQMLNLKSIWWNEIRTYTRASAEAATRRLTGSLPPKEFSTPGQVLENLPAVLEAKKEPRSNENDMPF